MGLFLGESPEACGRVLAVPRLLLWPSSLHKPAGTVAGTGLSLL